jgi:hypothetical protein
MAGHTSWVRREPIGVVGQVTPWNYPLLMAVWKIAPALAAGNTVVLKPSDTTPESTLLLAEIPAEFLPPGVFNVVCGDRDTGAALVRHPIPQMVSITGSVGAGINVAKSAAEQVKRVHLELGGKAPVIVFDDADLELAAENIAIAGYFNAGQDCTAATRVLAGPKIHDDFVAALALSDPTGLERGVVGQPVDHAADVLELGAVVERSVVGVLVCRVTRRHPLGRLGEGRDELVVDPWGHQHAGGRRAVLAGIEESGAGDALGGLLDVGVVEDDDRCLAAELEMHALEVGRCRLGHLHARSHRAGDRHHLRSRQPLSHAACRARTRVG